MSEVRLYNTLSKSLELLKPLKEEVSLYCCGPTVYNFQHIGNLRTYIFEDVLRRTISFTGLKIRHVMNITDVGHLASDADEGEDKMLLASQREGKKSKDIAEYYSRVFFEDCAQLNILRPHIVCKATEHIQEMIEVIGQLMQKGFAYESGGNVYFDVSKDKDYGKLAGLSLDALQAGARIEVDNAKRNPHDFALWFTQSKFEDQELQWDSPWGRGYPGWHIECSAMSMKYLGESFDIHCGGIDHIPVHHTNEIAQSECASGKPFASVWLHGGFLVESSGKMSKSKGEFLTLKTLSEKGFSPLSFRYLCFQSHYRHELAWSYEALEGAKNALQKIVEKVGELLLSTEMSKEPSQEGVSHLKTFRQALCNDLNGPQALAALHEMLSDTSLSKEEKLHLISRFDEVLALDLLEQGKTLFSDIPQHIVELADKRDQARFERSFEEADRLRDQMLEEGYEVKDGPRNSDGSGTPSARTIKRIR